LRESKAREDSAAGALRNGLQARGRRFILRISSRPESAMSSTSAVLEYDFCETPFGDCLIAQTRRGLCSVDFTNGQQDSALARLERGHPGARLQRAELAYVVPQIFSDCEAAPAVDVAGTEFQRQVWEALRQIPRGATLSYGELAAAVGRPGAARAVGRAVASNPLAVLVPCHRVLPATGGQGGYRWGVSRKAALLAWEGANVA
jgi:AraC family transcriptional regulator of adaptative response/methylated-DNA-[protein]-cysteine methyltransferase